MSPTIQYNSSFDGRSFFHLSYFSFISVVLERYPDDEEVRNLLESINTNIQKQKKGKKGTTKKNSKAVGTGLCLPDPGENIFRIFKDHTTSLQQSCKNSCQDSCKDPQVSSCLS